MNKDILQGSWTELKGKIKKQWSKFTDDEIGQMEGKTAELQGHLQKKYSYGKERAHEEIKKFLEENE